VTTVTTMTGRTHTTREAAEAGVDSGQAISVRTLRPADMQDVRHIDATHTGEKRDAYWKRIAQEFFKGADDDRFRIALAVEAPDAPDELAGAVTGTISGFLLGEVRAFEFGSDACGWIFAVGVDPTCTRHGVASALLDEACARFAREGVHRVRTMVLRDDVPVLSFFRSNGFVGGSFAQLEIDLPSQPTDPPDAAPPTENAA
jgi:ribosomal protein S18 acetylase RimI-like enzyme